MQACSCWHGVPYGRIWVFNTYSGIAHAFAWPTMVPGATDRLPGNFVSDLGTTVAVAALAVQAFTQAAR